MIAKATAPFCLALLAVTARADDFPEPFNNDPAGVDGPISAEKAAASFQLPEGFDVTVFACEPEVQNPIAMAWDRHGRMWIAENYTFSDRKTRFELSLRDRVLVFEDSNRDGVADERTVFTDNVQMLTSVEVGHGGVWLMCPPRLLFIPDADGDLKPDGEAQVVLDGFTVAQSNYHNFANGLRWGPDGWLYGRCGHSCPGRLGPPGTPDEKRVPIDGGMWRYHLERKVVEVLTHGTTNPWGHDWDEHGELFFINTVIGHLWHTIPGAHFKESFGQSMNPRVYDRIGQHADHFHYDRNNGWTKSRGGAANDFGGGHSHIGMTIYQADHLPEKWRGRLLTWNQHGRRLNVERLERHGSGYVGRHEPDAFLAGDPWFRGLDIRTGPDGALYALDWSDTGECHDHTGVHRTSGRIYRFAHGKSIPSPHLKIWPPGVMIAHPNAWFFRQWQKMAILDDTPLAKTNLKNLYENEKETIPRLRMLWTLHAMGEPTPAELLEDPDEHIRTWAIRLLTDAWPLDTIMGPLPHRPAEGDRNLEARFVDMAERDSSGLVRLALASTLQRLPVASRPALAKALASRDEDASDHNLPHMVWFGIMPVAESDPAALVDIAKATTWPNLQRWIARSLAEGIERHPHHVEALLEIAKTHPEHILAGMSDAFRGWRKAPKPGNWDTLATVLGDSETVRKLSILFGDGTALAELKALVFDGKADLTARQTALRSLIESRPSDLRETCKKLLKTRYLNIIAVRGLVHFNDPAIGEDLARNYTRYFRPQNRQPVMDVLTSRAAWAGSLLDAMDEGKIPRADLTPFHARQIQGFGDEKLTARLHEVWGQVRKSDAARARRAAEIKATLTPDVLAKADLGKGRAIYKAVCASCHVLYGEGGKLGPDLTGSGRSNLDYLLENTLDPSAVVSAEYRMTTLTLKDGRVLGGVIAEENDRTLTFRMLTEESAINKSEIAMREPTAQSIMPDALLDALPPDQLRDLIAYLMHPRQVPLPE